MINAARVMMILAGLFALPAVGCGSCMYEVSRETGDTGSTQFYGLLTNLAALAAAASIAAGAFARNFRRVLTCTICLGSTIIFGLMWYLPFGLVSSLLSLVAGVIVFVAPSSKFVPSKRP